MLTIDIDERVIMARHTSMPGKLRAAFLKKTYALTEKLNSKVQQNLTNRLLNIRTGKLAIGEKLNAMGAAGAPRLEHRIHGDGDLESKVHGALLLLHFGSQVGVDQLLKAVEEGVGPTGLIIRKLIDSGIDVPGAADALTDALRGCIARKDPFYAATFIDELRSLGARVPDDILEWVSKTAPYLLKEKV